MANHNLVRYTLEHRLLREIRRKISCKYFKFKLRKVGDLNTIKKEESI